MKKALLIQLQSDTSSSEMVVVDQFISFVEKVVGSENLKLESNPDQEWINLSIDAPDPVVQWKKLRSSLSRSAALLEWAEKKWIVVCEGDDGWNDYKTLAHFDAQVKLDTP
jgi:hypothetical protein